MGVVYTVNSVIGHEATLRQSVADHVTRVCEQSVWKRGKGKPDTETRVVFYDWSECVMSVM